MLAIGQIVEVEVTTVAVFGVFCRHDEHDVLVLIPDTSWIASFCSCHQFAKRGDRFTVKVIHVDEATGKISGSIKAVHPDPWAAGHLAPGTTHLARVVHYVEKADRCNDSPGYLVEVLPGAYALLCADRFTVESGQQCMVTVTESNFSKRAVRVVVNDST
jgi:predicted RNA-binding protein with RPS1 domain